MIAISIVSHGQGELVARLLADLERIGNRTIALIVVTRNLPERWTPPARIGQADVVLIDNDQPIGFGANHNAAFARAVTAGRAFDRWVVANPDIRIEDDPFDVLSAAVSPLVMGVVSPVIVDEQGRVEDFARKLLTPVDLARRALGRRDRSADPAWLAGMFLFFRRDAFERVGGFDERFRLYCEDFDICARLRLAGHALSIAANARVMHVARRDSHRSWQHLRWHLQSLAKVWLSTAFWRYRALLQRGH